MNILEYLDTLRPALPLSAENPPSKDRAASPMSKGELKRQINQGAILINGFKCTHDEVLDYPVHSLVFFPKSTQRRTTLI